MCAVMKVCGNQADHQGKGKDRERTLKEAQNEGCCMWGQKVWGSRVSLGRPFNEQTSWKGERPLGHMGGCCVHITSCSFYWDWVLTWCLIKPGFDPWVGKIPWRRKWQPTPVFLVGSCLMETVATYLPMLYPLGGATGRERVQCDWGPWVAGTVVRPVIKDRLSRGHCLCNPTP